MKKGIFFTLAACFVMLLASCSKDVELPGTTWKGNFSNNVTYEGIEATVSLDMTIKFIDDTKYSLDETVSMMAMGQTMFSDSDSDNGTYTFDGEKGMFDEEQAFTYNKKDKTISVVLVVDDDEFAEMFGSNSIELIFTQQK